MITLEDTASMFLFLMDGTLKVVRAVLYGAQE